MQFLKSLIFNIFLFTGLITIFILAIPTLVLPSKFTIFFGRVSAKYIVFLIKIILHSKVIFHGVENLKKVDNFFVASAHQSMFETFARRITEFEQFRTTIFSHAMKRQTGHRTNTCN